MPWALWCVKKDTAFVINSRPGTDGRCDTYLPFCISLSDFLSPSQDLQLQDWNKSVYLTELLTELNKVLHFENLTWGLVMHFLEKLPRWAQFGYWTSPAGC